MVRRNGLQATSDIALGSALAGCHGGGQPDTLATTGSDRPGDIEAIDTRSLQTNGIVVIPGDGERRQFNADMAGDRILRHRPW